MKKLLLTLAVLISVAIPASARTKFQFDATDGTATVRGLSGSGSNVLKSCPGALIRVYTAGTLTLVTLYNSSGVSIGTSTTAHPTTGRFSFYIDDGDYDLRISGGGCTDHTWSSLVIGQSTIGINVTGFGALCDGTTDDFAAIFAAEAAATAQTNGGTVSFPPKTCRTASNITFSSDVTVNMARGAQLSVDSGDTVTFSGGLIGERSQIFSGSGSIVFTVGAPIDNVLPEWFGTTGTSLQTACNAASAGRLNVKLAHKIYDLPTGGLVITNDFFSITADPVIVQVSSSIAQDHNGATLRHTGGSNTFAITIGKTAGVSFSDWYNGFHMENVHVQVTAASSQGIRLWYTVDSKLVNVSVYGPGAASGNSGLLLAGNVHCHAWNLDVALFANGIYTVLANTSTKIYASYLHYCTYGVQADSGFGQVWIDLDGCTIENNSYGYITTATGFSNATITDCWFENNSEYAIYAQSASALIRVNNGQFSVDAADSGVFLENGARVSFQGVAAVLNQAGTSPLVASIGATSNFTITQSRFIGAGTLVIAGTTYPSSAATWQRVRITDMSIERLRFEQTALSGTQSLTAMPALSGGTTMVMPSAGDVLGVVFTYTGTISSGTFGYQVTKNGSSITGMTETGIASVPKRSNAEHWQFQFAAGDTLGVQLSTSSLVTSGSTMICDLIVALGEDNKH